MSHPARVQPLREWGGDGPPLLTWADLDVVRELLAELAPDWTAELNQASPNESTIVVTPAGANDLVGPAYILQRDRGRVQLDQFRWDEYRKLGGFPTLDAALAVLRSRLAVLESPKPSRMNHGDLQ